VKKLPGRAHQYFASRPRRPHVQRRRAHHLAHAQGSGKSIVLSARKWILENNAHARVAIITDRDD